MVTTFAARQRLMLGQIKMADKSNEIAAIHKLLDMLAIEGTIVTIGSWDASARLPRRSSIIRPIMSSP